MDNNAGLARTQTLRGYGLMDTPNEAAFDEVVKSAAAALNTPMALLSLIDENRQWLKARIGLEATEIPLSISFCTHALRGPDMFVVRDATKDERFANNPLVTRDPSLRFYAGVPLTAPNGTRIGTLCVLDTRARRMPTHAEEAQLLALADRVMQLMEKRREAAVAGKSGPGQSANGITA